MKNIKTFRVSLFIILVITLCTFKTASALQDDLTKTDIVIDQILLTPSPNVDFNQLPKIELNRLILSQILISEIALINNEPLIAFSHYFDLAKNTLDQRFAERATRIAILNNDPLRALAAAQLWYKIAPNSSRAEQILAILYTSIGQLELAENFLDKILSQASTTEKKQIIPKIYSIISQNPYYKNKLTLLNKLFNDYQNLPETLLVFAKQAILENQQALAFSYLEKALTLRPNYLEVAKIISTMDPDYLQKGLAIFKQLESSNPQNALIVSGLTDLYISNNQSNNAINLLKKLNQQQSHQFEGVKQLTLIYLFNKQFSEAQALLENFISKNPKHAQLDQAYLLLAQSLLNQNQLPQAKVWLEKITPLSVSFASAQILLTQIQLVLKNTDQAQQIINRLNHYPLTIEQYIDVTRINIDILVSQKKYQEAYQAAKNTVKRFPNHPELLYLYAFLAQKTNHIQETFQALHHIIKIQPDSAKAYNALGYLLLERNQDLQKATQYIEKAYSLDPYNSAIIDSLGWLRVKQGQYPEALALLEFAFESLPNAEIGSHLGAVLWLTNRKNEAAAIWQKSWEIDPHDPELQKIFKRYKFKPRSSSKK